MRSIYNVQTSHSVLRRERYVKIIQLDSKIITILSTKDRILCLARLLAVITLINHIGLTYNNLISQVTILCKTV